MRLPRFHIQTVMIVAAVVAYVLRIPWREIAPSAFGVGLGLAHLLALVLTPLILLWTVVFLSDRYLSAHRSGSHARNKTHM